MADKEYCLLKFFVKILFGLFLIFLLYGILQGISESSENSESKINNGNTSSNNNSSGTHSSSTHSNSNSRGDPDAVNWDISTLDTAAEMDYLLPAEKDIILEMNMVRIDPKKYAEMYINPNLGAYAKECYEELRSAESRSVLFPKKGLAQAAKDHVADTGPKGVVGHDGTDGSSMSDRIERYGTWGGGASENISYGYNAAREIVLQLLIDDGVSSRGHRKNIMDKNSRYVGVATGTHSTYRYMCVQDFAVDYTDR